MSPRILLIEDHPNHRKPLEAGLRRDGYEVLSAADGPSGLRCAISNLPDLIVLDVKLPTLSGLEVARQLRRSEATREIPIIMMTADGATTDEVSLEAGGSVFLQKPFGYKALAANIKRQLQNRPPYHQPPNEVVLSIRVRHGAPPTAHVRGAGDASVDGDLPVSLEPTNLARDGRSILRDRDDWRRRAKTLGYQMYQQVFQRKIVEKANSFRAPGRARHVRMRFQTDRAHMGVPLEMLFDDEIMENGEFLVLRHPVSRYMTGISRDRDPISRGFLNKLAATGEKLRVLLIASNTPPFNAGVDAEIESLARAIPAAFRARRINVADTVVIRTSEATTSRVLAALEQCRAHIVHYAGHGQSHPDAPENSALYFWSQPNGAGEVEPLTAAAIKAVMRECDTRLLYLSCCFGGDVGSAVTLLDGDLLGIGEALIQVGVPSVLSFRSAVNDDSAKALAETFYEALARDGESDLALLDARQKLSRHPADRVWLSPTLILQDH